MICDGEIGWTSEGYWFCLKCGSTGGIDTPEEHLEPTLNEQEKCASSALEIHFGRLLMADMSRNEAWIWFESEVARVALEYVE